MIQKSIVDNLLFHEKQLINFLPEKVYSNSKTPLIRIAIVGSRTRKDKNTVYKAIDILFKKTSGNLEIVSGGCWGVDSWAEERAKELGLEPKIFKPNLTNVTSREDMINRYYTRNKQIAEYSDIILAFVGKSRRGGTENTIKWARLANKKVIIC